MRHRHRHALPNLQQSPAGSSSRLGRQEVAALAPARRQPAHGRRGQRRPPAQAPVLQPLEDAAVEAEGAAQGARALHRPGAQEVPWLRGPRRRPGHFDRPALSHPRECQGPQAAPVHLAQ